MNHAVKVQQVGRSLGIVLPDDVVGQLNLSKGDTVHLAQGPEGYRLVAHDPNFERAMVTYRKGASRYRNSLRKLAG